MTRTDNSFFETDSVWHILGRLVPPVVFAMLVQCAYNLVDSYFIGKFSDAALAAISVIFPIQFLICALAVGSGVGVNTVMARYYGKKDKEQAILVGATGTWLSIIEWLLFALVSYFVLPAYCRIALVGKDAVQYAIDYGLLVCVISLPLFLESNWSKVLQSQGDMKTPMYAQIAGAITNIILDPPLIFGYGFIPALGMKGAAIATVIGQLVAALLVIHRGLIWDTRLKLLYSYVKEIYTAALPNIVMQSLYTVYIGGLNFVLVAFGDAAVTVLGLYYKLQTFFFIGFEALSICIVPVISYNYAAGHASRCLEVLWKTVFLAFLTMAFSLVCFMLWPRELLALFTHNTEVLQIGNYGLKIISLSFLQTSVSLIFPFYFQAIGYNWQSISTTVLRQLILFVPIGYVLSLKGLEAFWWTFPITDTISMLYCLLLYRRYSII